MPLPIPRRSLWMSSALAAALTLVVACDRGDATPPVRVSIDPGDTTLEVGAELTLTATVTGAHEQGTLTWSSSDPSVASVERVDGAGLVRGEAEGTAEITAQSSLDASASDSVTVSVVPAATAVGVLLAGDPDALAVSVTTDLSVPIDRDPDLVSVDEDSPFRERYHRGEIEIGFVVTATVGQVNALLEAFEARIVDMLPDHPQVIVRVPDPGSLQGLRSLAAAIEEDAIVEFVLLSELVEAPDTGPNTALADATRAASAAVGRLVLPGEIGTRLERVDHQLAVRAHAAWHARSAVVGHDDRPWLVVPDFYGDGRPDLTYYDATFASAEFATGDPHSHGYHVLGIMIGTFDHAFTGVTPEDEEQDNDDVTGVVPAGLRVRIVDLRDVNTTPRNMNRTISRIEHILSQNPGANIVVNTSLGNRSSSSTYARSWTRKVRGWSDADTVGAGLEHRFLHFTAAGNVERDDDGNIIDTWPAVDSSTWTYAALGDMSATVGRDYPNLTNIFVVENRRSTEHGAGGSRPLPSCAAEGSIMGGNLSAIGTDVYSFATTVDRDNDVHDVSTPSEKSGTSMASPQAAGVAALVWSLAPDLSVPDLFDLISQTALDDPGGGGSDCNSAAPQPVVDAYAAVLAAGGVDAWRAVLDVNADGVFDEDDIELYLAAFAGQGSELAYDRFDLTGDGRSGSQARTERLDLTGDGQFGTVNRSIAGRTITYDQSALSDHDVLCYHAYTSTYQGSTAPRDELLNELCAGVAVRVVNPQDGDMLWAGDGVFLEAELYTAWPDAPAIDPALYTIHWSYLLEDGERMQLGVSTDGEELEAELVCRDAIVTAEARHRNVPRVSRDSVAFTLLGAQPTPWTPVITEPLSRTSYLNVSLPTNTVTLRGVASRVDCPGIEPADPDDLRWSVQGDGSFATVSGPELTVTTSQLASGGGYEERTFVLRRLHGISTSHRVVPCTSLVFGELRRCPDPALTSAVEDALAKRFQDYYDAQDARAALEAELLGLLDGVVPSPFPFPEPTLTQRLSEELDSFEWEMSFQLFGDLFDLVGQADEPGFSAALLDLEVLASAQLGDLLPEVLELFLAASGVTQAVHTHFQPAEGGGGDGWSTFQFADPASLDDAALSAPVAAALHGFLTGFAETHDGGPGMFSSADYDLETSVEVGVIAAGIAAIDELWP